MNDRFCPYCGQPTEPNAPFCTSCGKQVSGQQQAQSSSPATYQAQPQRQPQAQVTKSRKPAKVSTAANAAAGVLITIGVLLLLLAVYLLIGGAISGTYGSSDYVIDGGGALPVHVNDPLGGSGQYAVTIYYYAFYSDQSPVVRVEDCGTDSTCSSVSPVTLTSQGTSSACDSSDTCYEITFSGQNGNYYEVTTTEAAYIWGSTTYSDAMDDGYIGMIAGILLTSVGGGVYGAGRSSARKIRDQNLAESLSGTMAPGEKTLSKIMAVVVTGGGQTIRYGGGTLYTQGGARFRSGYLFLTSKRIFYFGENSERTGFIVDPNADWNLNDLGEAELVKIPGNRAFSDMLIAGTRFRVMARTAPDFKNALSTAFHQVATRQRQVTPQAQQTVVTREIIKEIVKVPCPYCRHLILNTDAKCEACGAPMRW